MANPEHLEIIEHGAEVWNAWRTNNPDVIPDLRGVTIADKRLHYIDLREADLTETNLAHCDLFSANLNDAKLNKAVLTKTDFLAAVFIRSDLQRAICTETNFEGAAVIDSLLSFANLRGCSFRNAILDRTTLRSADLMQTDFSGASLHGTDFSHAIAGLTSFTDIDLSEALGLDSMGHRGPSTIGVDTLYKSAGKIPEVFLRGCGVPESFITQLPSLITSAAPIQFYKCFISFTEADDLFSERLYNDLQGAGVRCWRWKEDARWGRNLMRSIDEAVRVYDKLIIICSEQSLNSPAVIREVERALQKEDGLARGGKEAEVLFPIRLDDYIIDGWEHYRKADVVAKHVGDFRDWAEPERYKKAFDRLLRDLKAS